MRHRWQATPNIVHNVRCSVAGNYLSGNYFGSPRDFYLERHFSTVCTKSFQKSAIKLWVSDVIYM